MPFIVPAYAGALALICLFLAIRVSLLRGGTKVMIGSGGNPRLERAIRAHGNFSEYVPIALILLGFMEFQQDSHTLLHALCLLLIAGRLLHAYGISQVDEKMPFRVSGTLASQAVLVVAAIALIVNYFHVA
jgi:uncharacterized protein